MQNEMIAVADKVLWKVWKLTGRDEQLFSQLMKNNSPKPLAGRVRIMGSCKLLCSLRNRNVGLASSIVQEVRHPTATRYYPYKTQKRWTFKLEKYNVMTNDDCRNKFVPFSTPSCPHKRSIISRYFKIIKDY